VHVHGLTGARRQIVARKQGSAAAVGDLKVAQADGRAFAGSGPGWRGCDGLDVGVDRRGSQAVASHRTVSSAIPTLCAESNTLGIKFG